MGADAFSIDTRHKNWLSHLLHSGRFRRVLEVGSWQGFSTSAFLSALDAGRVQEVVLVEPFPKPELLDAIATCRRRDRVTLHEIDSVTFLGRDTDWDFLFLDGLHTADNVLAELVHLMPADIPCVALHDVGSAGRIDGCDGPQHALRAYQHAGYLTLTDQLIRDGERTERGFATCCRTPDLYQVALEGYRQHC